MPVRDNILLNDITVERFYIHCQKQLHNTTVSIVVEREPQVTIKVNHFFEVKVQPY